MDFDRGFPRRTIIAGVGAGLAGLLPAGLRAQTAQPAPNDIVKSDHAT